MSGAGELLEEKAMVARAREVEGVWDGDKMDQIKPKALNFFFVPCHHHLAVPDGKHTKGTKKYPRPETRFTRFTHTPRVL